MSTIPQRIASAFAVLCGQTVTSPKGHANESNRGKRCTRGRAARQRRGWPRGPVPHPRSSAATHRAACSSPSPPRAAETRRGDHPRHTGRVRHRRPGRGSQSERRPATVAGRGGSNSIRSVPTLGRATLEAGERAGRLLQVLDEKARPEVEQAAADEIFGRKPVLMLVEPESLCWLTGRMVPMRDGATWSQEFARFPALKSVVRDDGTGLGKGLKLEATDIAPPASPSSTTRSTSFTPSARGAAPCGRVGPRSPRLGTRPMRPRRDWTSAAVRDDRGPASPRRRTACGVGLSNSGIKHWPPSRPGTGQVGVQFFTPEGRFNDRRQAEAVVAATLPHLSGPAWAKTRRLLQRRERFTSLDQVQQRLADLGWDPDILSALLDLEGLRRQPWRLSATAPASPSTRAWALVGTVQLAKASPDWRDQGRWVRAVFRGVWCASTWWSVSTAWRDATGAASEDDAGFARPEASGPGICVVSAPAAARIRRLTGCSV